MNSAMLSLNRSTFKGRKYNATIKCLVLCLWAVLVLAAGLRAELVDRVVAIVNNDIILLSELNQSLAILSATLDRQGYSQSQKNQILNNQRAHILEQLIYDKLTDQQIKKHDIKIDDSEVDATIQRIQKVNRISDEDLRRSLELDGISYEDYRNQIKEKLLRARLVNREIKSKIVITDEDIQAYYKAHLEEYGGHTKYELRHILIKVQPPANSAVNESAHEKIEYIYKELKDGKAFAKLAGEYSEAPSSAREGHLGVFDLNILSDQIKAALKGLEVGQFSKVVETDQGYQIFYVENIIQSGGRGIDEARAEIQEKLYADVVDHKFNEWIKDLRQRSHIQIME